MNIPIFLSSDNNYAPFVATTMASILSNTNSFIEFYVLDGGITSKNVEKIQSLKNKFNNFSIEFIKIDYEEYLKNFKEIGHWNKSVYARFLIPDLKTQINKAIYLDVDIIATGDIANLYNEDLEEYALGAVCEQWAEYGINITHKERLQISEPHNYFNSGVLILDCNKWRKNNVLDSLSQIAYDDADKIQMPDQDILNKYFDNNYKILPKKYNYLTPYFYIETNHNYIIRHLVGYVRPWQLNQNIKTDLMPNLKEFWHYAKMTPFYEELDAKTHDKKQQLKYLRHLPLVKISMLSQAGIKPDMQMKEANHD